MMKICSLDCLLPNEKTPATNLATTQLSCALTLQQQQQPSSLHKQLLNANLRIQVLGHFNCVMNDFFWPTILLPVFVVFVDDTICRLIKLFMRAFCV